MLFIPATVKGYYDGKQIIMEKNINIKAGQKVIITILDMPDKAKKKINLKKYTGRGEKMFNSDAQEYIKELRKNDRI